jgi:hypothetical protein
MYTPAFSRPTEVRWRWVVSYTRRLIYSQEEAPGSNEYETGWIRKSVCLTQELEILDSTELEIRLLGLPDRSQSLYRLLYPDYIEIDVRI